MLNSFTSPQALNWVCTSFSSSAVVHRGGEKNTFQMFKDILMGKKTGRQTCSWMSKLLKRIGRFWPNRAERERTSLFAAAKPWSCQSRDFLREVKFFMARRQIYFGIKISLAWSTKGEDINSYCVFPEFRARFFYTWGILQLSMDVKRCTQGQWSHNFSTFSLHVLATVNNRGSWALAPLLLGGWIDGNPITNPIALSSLSSTAKET